MNQRVSLAIFLLLLLESALSFYVFNYTTRERTPKTIFLSKEATSCFDISNWGDSLCIGTVNGTLSYYQGVQNEPQWVYKGNSGIDSVLMTIEGDYILTMDKNDTISLFRSLGVGVNTPKWRYQLHGGKILGISSSGGIPPIVYILASVDGNIMLFSNKDGLIWEYPTGTSRVDAEISFNGKYIAAVDSVGNVYMFNIGEPHPIWLSSTRMIDAYISLSQTSMLTVGGEDISEGGRILSLSLKDGGSIWNLSTMSPIDYISMSSDGSKVVIHESEGDTSIFRYNFGEVTRTILKSLGRVESVWSPPFGSYVVSLNSDGYVFFSYIFRQTPLWTYDAGSNVIRIDGTSIGDKVFIADKTSVVMLTNTVETGIIPGSRSQWGACFMIGIAGLIVIYSMTGMHLNLQNKIKESYQLLVSGFLIGGIFGLVLYGEVLPVFAAAVSCAVGLYLGSIKEGIGGFAVGLFFSVTISLIVSILHGLFVWFSGVEHNIIFLIMISVSVGTHVAFVCGLLGTTLGLLVKKFWGGR